MKTSATLFAVTIIGSCLSVSHAGSIGQYPTNVRSQKTQSPAAQDLRDSRNPSMPLHDNRTDKSRQSSRPRDVGGPPTLGTFLDTSLVSREVQEAFLSRYLKIF